MSDSVVGKKIVITGGPGAGKTTAIDLFRRELGASVAMVPEAATLLFSGGFPRTELPDGKRAVQRAIFQVQRCLEDVQESLHPNRILLCDRGTLDGAAYWPEGPEAFCESQGMRLDQELRRYSAVLFFETAARGGLSIESTNATRNESLKAAVELDDRLKKIWSQHPCFQLVRHEKSFFSKLHSGFEALQKWIGPNGEFRVNAPLGPIKAQAK